jgi:hypothetical protein
MIRGSIPDKNERETASKTLKLALRPTKPAFRWFNRDQIGRRVNLTPFSFHTVLLSISFSFYSPLEAVRSTKYISRVCEPRHVKYAHISVHIYYNFVS